MSKKTIGIIASIALVLSLAVANVASALTAADISMLQAAGIISASQAASLSASIAAPVVSSGYTFTHDLSLVGQKTNVAADVTALQQILVNGGYLKMPAGTPMGYFGNLTKLALIKYQVANGISPAVGYFGAKTRAKLNGGSTSAVNNVVPTGTDLSVSLAATSPVSGAIIAGQAAADLAEFTFTNKSATPAVVTNITLQRGGVSADTNLTSVYLFNGAVRLTDAATVSTGKVTFNAGNGLFTIPAGSSVVVAVKADIDASSTPASNISLSLTGVTSNLPVSAVYPIPGSSMTLVGKPSDLATASLATTTITGTSTAGSIQVGTSNQTIWSSNMNLSGKYVWLKSVAVKVIGSAPVNALQNIKLYVGGILVGTSAGEDSNGIITFDLTTNPYKIDSSRLIEVRADIVSGSSRTFNVQLQNASDVQLIDSNYNISIPVTLASGSSMSSGVWTINLSTGGSLVVNADPNSASNNVISGATNISFAKYNVTAYGESEKISQISVTINKDLQNVALFVNGSQVGSTQNVSSGVAKTFNLGSSFVAPVGQVVSLEVKGDLKELNGTNSSTTASSTFTVNVTVPSSQAQGTESFQTNTSDYGPFPANALTVILGGLGISKNNSGFITTATPNTLKKIGSYILTSGSAEAINVQSLVVNLSGQALNVNGEVTNLYVVPAGSAASNIVAQPSASNNFNVNFNVPASGSTVVDVYATLGASSSSALSSSMQALGTGAVSFTSLTSGVAYNGQSVVVGNGTITAVNTITSDAFASAQFVVGGSNTPANIARYNFVSTGGDSTLSEMYFTITGGIDSIVINGVSTPVSGGYATTTSNIVVPSGYAGKDIIVAANYSAVGAGLTATSGTLTSITLTGYKYISGGSPVPATTTKASQSMTLVSAKPTLAVANGIGTDAQGAGYKTLARITVGANSGSIKLNQLAVTAATSGDAVISGNLDLVDTNTGLSIATTTVASGIFSLGIGPTAGYIITNSSVFEVKANVSGTYAASGMISTTISVTKANFIWTDIGGNATSTGSGIVPFPTAGGVVTF